MRLKQKYFIRVFEEIAVIPVNPKMHRIYSEYFRAQKFSEHIAKLVRDGKHEQLQALHRLYARYRAYSFYWFYVKVMLDRKFAKAVDAKFRWLVANYDTRASREVQNPETVFLQHVRGVGQFPLYFRAVLSLNTQDRDEYLLDFQKTFGSEVTNYVSSRLDFMQGVCSKSKSKSEKEAAYYRETYLPKANSVQEYFQSHMLPSDFEDLNQKYLDSGDYFHAESPVEFQD